MERGNHILGHKLSGIASHSLFLSTTTYITNFTDAVERAKTLNRSPPTTTATTDLTDHDNRRSLAVAQHDENMGAFVVAFAQGGVLVIAAVAAQVLTRVARNHMEIVLQGKLTKMEAGVVLATVANVLLVLYLGSLKGKDIALDLVFYVMGFVWFFLLVQLTCLYQVCSAVIDGHHSPLAERAPPRLPSFFAGIHF